MDNNKKHKPNVWFTSDPHFCHAAVIGYDNRPFSTVEEMDLAIINNWNSAVTQRIPCMC